MSSSEEKQVWPNPYPKQYTSSIDDLLKKHVNKIVRAQKKLDNFLSHVQFHTKSQTDGDVVIVAATEQKLSALASEINGNAPARILRRLNDGLLYVHQDDRKIKLPEIQNKDPTLDSAKAALTACKNTFTSVLTLGQAIALHAKLVSTREEALATIEKLSTSMEGEGLANAFKDADLENRLRKEVDSRLKSFKDELAWKRAMGSIHAKPEFVIQDEPIIDDEEEKIDVPRRAERTPNHRRQPSRAAKKRNQKQPNTEKPAKPSAPHKKEKPKKKKEKAKNQEKKDRKGKKHKAKNNSS
jgi:hypothetical protein